MFGNHCFRLIIPRLIPLYSKVKCKWRGFICYQIWQIAKYSTVVIVEKDFREYYTLLALFLLIIMLLLLINCHKVAWWFDQQESSTWSSHWPVPGSRQNIFRSMSWRGLVIWLCTQTTSVSSSLRWPTHLYSHLSNDSLFCEPHHSWCSQFKKYQVNIWNISSLQIESTFGVLLRVHELHRIAYRRELTRQGNVTISVLFLKLSFFCLSW